MLINSRLIPLILFLLLIHESWAKKSNGRRRNLDNGGKTNKTKPFNIWDFNRDTSLDGNFALNIPSLVESWSQGLYNTFEAAARELIFKHSSMPEEEEMELPSLAFLLPDHYNDFDDYGTRLGADKEVIQPEMPIVSIAHGMLPLFHDLHIQNELEKKLLSSSLDLVSRGVSVTDDVTANYDTNFTANVHSFGHITTNRTIYYTYIDQNHDTEKELSKLHEKIGNQGKIFRNMLNKDMSLCMPLTDNLTISHHSFAELTFQADEISVERIEADNVSITFVDGKRLDDVLKYAMDHRLSINEKTLLTGPKKFKKKVLVKGDVTSGNLNDIDFKKVVKTDQTNHVSSHLMFEVETVSVGDLQLPDHEVEDMIFINKDTELVVPIEVKFEDLVVKELGVDTGFVGDFDVKDAYLFNENSQEFQSELILQGDVETKAKELNVDYLNDRVLNQNTFADLMQLNGEVTLNNLTLTDVFVKTSSNESVMIEKVNGISIPEQLMCKDDSINDWCNPNVTAGHSFKNVSLDTADVDGVVDSILLSEVVSLLNEDEDELIAGKISFLNGIDIFGNLNLGGNITGSNMTFLAQEYERIRQEVDIQGQHRNGNVTLEVVVNGNITFGHQEKVMVNNIDLRNIVNEVIILNESSESVNITGTKTFTQFLKPSSLKVSIINRINFDNFSIVHANETITSVVILNSPKLTHLRTSTSLDGNILGFLHRAAQHFIMQSYSQEYNYFEELMYGSVKVDHLISEISPDKLETKNMSSTEDYLKIFNMAQIKAKRMRVGSLLFTGTLDGVAKSLIQHRVDLNNQQLIPSASLVDSAVQDLVLEGSVVGVNWTHFLGNVLLNNGDQILTGNKIFVNETEAVNNVETSLGLIPEHLQLNKDNEVIKIIFENDLTVDAATFYRLRKVHLNRLSKQGLRIKGNQECLGKTTFQHGFTVNGDIEAEYLQGEYSHDLKKGNEWLILINSSDIPEQVFRGQFLELPEAHFRKLNINTRDVTLEQRFSIPDTVFDLLPNCSSPDIPDGSHVLVATNGTVFNKDLKPKNISSSSFFKLKWSSQVEDMININSKKVVELPSKTFTTEAIRFRGSLKLESLLTEHLNNHSLRIWNTLPFTSFEGMKTFKDNVKIQSANFKGLINDVEPEQEVQRRNVNTTEPKPEKPIPRPKPEIIEPNFVDVLVVDTLHVKKINDRVISESVIPLNGSVKVQGRVSFSSEAELNIGHLRVEKDIKTSCGFSCFLGSSHLKTLSSLVSEMEDSLSYWKLSGEFSVIQELSISSIASESKRVNGKTYVQLETQKRQGQKLCRLGKVYLFNLLVVPDNLPVLQPIFSSGIFLSKSPPCSENGFQISISSSSSSSPHAIQNDHLKDILIKYGANGLAFLDDDKEGYHRKVIISSPYGTEVLDLTSVGDYRTMQRLPFGSKKIQVLSSHSFLVLTNNAGFDRFIKMTFNKQFNLFEEEESLEYKLGVVDFQAFTFKNRQYLIVLSNDNLQVFSMESGSFVSRSPQKLDDCVAAKGIHVFIHDNMAVAVVSGMTTVIMKLLTEQVCNSV